MVRENTDSDEVAISPKETFDGIAHLYDEMRPSYPQTVFDDVIAISGIDEQSSILEIGCGTGHATLGLATHGFHIDCVELGANLAAFTSKKLAPFPRVRVTTADFDTWTASRQYDLAFSASAYHWLDPKTRTSRIAALLNPAGWIAVWRNHHVRTSEAGHAFLDASQQIYTKQAPSLAAKFVGLPESHEIPLTEKMEWLASGIYQHSQTRTYLWQKQYTAREYVRMLDTHSDHRMLAKEERAHLFQALEQLIDAEFGGMIVKDYATIFQIARKNH